MAEEKCVCYLCKKEFDVKNGFRVVKSDEFDYQVEADLCAECFEKLYGRYRGGSRNG